ncbi:YybH family protein [Streptomyces sp. NPDC056169]|uniref:CycJ n=1 Tax=Streptomyces sp. NCIB 11649 TaxID=1756463 RepID=A0A0S2RRP3_9ACTN|nr:CycJ [Streptomyces sp. NCIB 11649]
MPSTNGTEHEKAFGELNRNYKAAFNSGDVDATLANYTAEGLTVVERGLALGRSGDLREALDGYFRTAQPHVEFEYAHTYVAGDVALVITEWTLEENAPDGGRTSTQGRATDVLVREPGGWRFAIDNRFGSS